MNRARIGALGTVAVLAPALLLTAGCAFVDGVKEGVSEAKNTAEVCTATITVANKHMTGLTTAATTYTAKSGDPAALETFHAAIKTEMSALHVGLQEQAGKAKEAKLKTAIENLDEQVNIVAQKPESITTTGTVIDERVADLNKACNATAPPETPAK